MAILRTHRSPHQPALRKRGRTPRRPPHAESEKVRWCYPVPVICSIDVDGPDRRHSSGSPVGPAHSGQEGEKLIRCRWMKPAA